MDRINGVDWIDIGGGRRGFRDENNSVGVPGTELTAAWLNAVQEELLCLAELNGAAASDTDFRQVARGIRSGGLNYRVAGGTANALVVALDPPVTGHAATVGMPVRLLITATNTGPASLNVGPGALPVRTMRGVNVAAGDLPAGAIMTVIGSGTAWLLTGLAYSEVPLADSPTIWVRTDGSDANDGSANTAGKALATISAAVAKMRAYSTSSAVAIRLGNTGAYAAPGPIDCGYRQVLLEGDAGNQNAYLITGSLDRLIGSVNGQIKLKGCNVRNAATGVIGVAANGQGSTVDLENVTLSGAAAFSSTLLLAEGGQLNIRSGCQITVGGGSAIGATNGGIAYLFGDLAVSGTPAFATAFATASECSQVRRGSNNPVITGAATGARYLAFQLSLISSNGAGANYFPGSVAGSVIAGSYGVYA